MKAAVTDGQGHVQLREIRIPEVGEYQCLCRILACATCSGTDQKIMKNALPWEMNYPAVLGHESVGRAVKLGAKVRNIREGDLFLRPTAVYQEERIGEYYSGWGGFAEYGLVTDTQALLEDRPDAEPHGYCQFQQRIPADMLMSAADATMLVTLKETASIIANMKVTIGTRMAILGSGSVALGMCRFAKVMGAAPVIVVGRREAPLAYIRKIGADFTVDVKSEDMVESVRDITEGKGLDFVLDTSGDVELVKRSVPCLTPEGKIVPYATYRTREEVKENVEPGRLMVMGPREVSAHEYLLDAVRLGLVNLAEFYSHRMPLSAVTEAFDLLKKKAAFKVVLETD